MTAKSNGITGCGKVAIGFIGLIASLLAIFTFLTGVVSIQDLNPQINERQVNDPVGQQPSYPTPTKNLVNYSPTPEMVLLEENYVPEGSTETFSIDVNRGEWVTGKAAKVTLNGWETDNDGRGCIIWELTSNYRHYDLTITSGEWHKYEYSDDSQIYWHVQHLKDDLLDSPECSGTNIMIIAR